MDYNMDLTEKYFNAMFENVNTNMKNMNDKLDKVISSVDRIDGKVVEHDVRISIVEEAHKDHLITHKEHDSKAQFNASQWIAVFLVITAILADKFL